MNNQTDFESNLHKALKKHGYNLPESEDEIEESEKALNEQNLPEMPKYLDDPIKILERGRIKTIEFDSPTINADAIRNLAMAAREGRKISEDVKKQMEKDRKEAEDKIKK
jgi:uncharacterized protein YneF (UPF0154 family)